MPVSVYIPLSFDPGHGASAPSGGFKSPLLTDTLPDTVPHPPHALTHPLHD